MQKKSYGNTTWIVVRTVAICTLFGVPVILFFTKTVDNLLLGLSPAIVFLLFCFAVIVVSVVKLPRGAEQLQLKTEFILTLVWMVFMVGGLGFYFPCPIGSTASSLTCFLKEGILTLMPCLIAWTSTIFVIDRNTNQCCGYADCEMYATFNQPSVIISQRSLTSWTEYAGDKHGFNLFAQYLVRQFAIENLLFLTEYMQFKHEHKSTIKQVLKGKDGYMVSLPATLIENRSTRFKFKVPFRSKTTDRHGTNELNALPSTSPTLNLPESLDAQFEKYGQFFYDKYIEVDSFFEINISWSVRQSLDDLFGDTSSVMTLTRSWSVFGTKQVHELTNKPACIIERLDDCAVEVVRLLESAFLRFWMTAEEPETK